MGIPPEGGGSFDAVNLAFDVEEYDSPASGDTVEKSVSETPVGVESDFQTEHVFQRVVLDADVDEVGATMRPQNPCLLIDPNTGNMFTAWQAGAGASPSGIVASWSLDGGFTWSAPAQVSSLNDPFVPSAVIDPSSGDVHMCMGPVGLPSLSSAWSIYEQVIPWTGAAWDVTLSRSLVAGGSAAQGYSNPSLSVDDNGYKAVAYMELESDNDVFINTRVAVSPWTFSGSVVDVEFQLTSGEESRIKLLWVNDVVDKKWLLMVEQNGTFRLYKNTLVLSGGQNDLAFSGSATYYESSTDEFDMVHMQQSLAGAVGIAQRVGDKVEFRSWSPDDGGLGSPTVVEGDVSNPCRYPAVMVDGGEFIVAYARETDTDDHQLIFQRSENSGATWNVDRVELDEDTAGNHWGWFKLSPSSVTWDRFAVVWCDNALAPYNVYFGMAAIPVVRAATDAAAGVDSISEFTTVVFETPVATEEVVGGEDKGPVSDTALAVEVFSQERPVAEAASADEDVELDPVFFDEEGEGVESFPGGSSMQVDETPSAEETLVDSQELTAVDVGAGTEELGQIAPSDVQDVASAVESFPAMSRSILELVTALESFTEAGSNLAASIYDTVVGHTSILHRLDSGQWTEAAEQAGIAYDYQKIYYFEQSAGMDNILFRRSQPNTSQSSGWRDWSALERSPDGGITWATVLDDCADVAFGPGGTGFAIAKGGDSRVHRVYRSVDQGVTWVEVWEDTAIATGLYSSYQRIAVDPWDDDHVALVGHAEGDDIGAVVFTASVDGFSTAPMRNRRPFGGFFLWRPMVLGGGQSGRWVWGLTPDSIVDVRNRVYTTDSDGVKWDLRFDEAWRTVNQSWEDILYNKAGNLWYLVHRSSSAPLVRSINGAEIWQPIDINKIQDADDPDSVVNYSSAVIQAVALAYDGSTDTVFVGVQDSDYPVIAGLSPVASTVWANLRENMVAVTGPGSNQASRVQCSAEGLINLRPVGEVRTTLQDVGSVVEDLTTRYSVMETVVGVDEIVSRVIGMVESATGEDTLEINLLVVESPEGLETLTVVLEITDLAAAVETFTRASELWLAVRIMLHEGIAHVRLEGPAGDAVYGR